MNALADQYAAPAPPRIKPSCHVRIFFQSGHHRAGGAVTSRGTWRVTNAIAMAVKKTGTDQNARASRQLPPKSRRIIGPVIATATISPISMPFEKMAVPRPIVLGTQALTSDGKVGWKRRLRSP